MGGKGFIGTIVTSLMVWVVWIKFANIGEFSFSCVFKEIIVKITSY
jgi:hypothetical protein